MIIFKQNHKKTAMKRKGDQNKITFKRHLETTVAKNLPLKCYIVAGIYKKKLMLPPSLKILDLPL